MKLSNIIDNFVNKNDYKIINEKEFDYICLAEAKLNKNACTYICDKNYIEKLADNITMVITTEELSNYIDRGKCIVKDPRVFIAKMHNYLADIEEYKRKEFNTTIGKNCVISAKANISPVNVIIGDNCIIEEGVSIKSNTSIGNNCIIRANSIIGSDGFECKRITEENTMLMVKHCGGVKIDDDVEIHCNNCIDKAVYPWDNTVVGKNTKTDNFVHIAHACKIGKRVLIAAQATIGGSVTVEDDVWIGLGAVIKNSIKISNNSRVNMGAVVISDVKQGEAVFGNPARRFM